VTAPREIDATPAEASALIRDQLLKARHALHHNNLDLALDRFVTALGLAFQLGPAASQSVLSEVMDAAREMACQIDAEALSALGPAIVGLVDQMQKADALPTAVMEAWAQLAAALGALIGQLGLALTLPADHRTGMMAHTRARAAFLDESTGNLFALTAWIDQITAGIENNAADQSSQL
jgi:hypothetical protein